MFVPSQSWQNEHLYIKMAKKDAFSYLVDALDDKVALLIELIL
jgi:hypothetical protein